MSDNFEVRPAGLNNLVQIIVANALEYDFGEATGAKIFLTFLEFATLLFAITRQQ